MKIYRNNIKPFLNHALNKKHILKSLLNFFRWQLLLRHANANKSYVIAPYIGNLKVIAKKGLYGITGNLYSGLQEFDEMGFVLHFLRKNDLFLDLGANVGIYTLLASGLREAKSFSFEPIPSTFCFLKNNIAVNNLEKVVTLYNTGLGRDESVLRFSLDKDAMNRVVGSNYVGETQLIKVVSLDKELANKIDGVTLIKIDTEGFEDQILLGAGEILNNKNVKVVLVEMNKAEAINEILTEYGFEPFGYDVFKKQLIKVNFKTIQNGIYIKDEKFVLERVSTSEPVKINSHFI